MSFELQPILSGRLIQLRPLRADDFDDLFLVASDPLIWEQHPVKSRATRDGFEAFFRESLESGGALVVTEIETGKIIGSSRFHGYSAERREVEIGWTFLARRYWGGVYNGEMKDLMMRHAFRFVRHIVFFVGSGNIRSQRAVERIGATRIGVRPDAGGRESFAYRISADGHADLSAQHDT